MDARQALGKLRTQQDQLYLKQLQKQADRTNSVNRPAILIDPHHIQQGEDTRRVQQINTGANPTGEPIAVKSGSRSLYVDGRATVKPPTTSTSTDEYQFDFTFNSIKPTSQIYQFKGGGKSKEISFENRDNQDNPSVGQIKLRLKTTNKKLSLSFSATIDGTRQTDVSVFFNPVDPIILKTKYKAVADVKAGGAFNTLTSEFGSPQSFVTYIITGNPNVEGTSQDSTVWVDPLFPASSSTFVPRNPGVTSGEQINGRIASTGDHQLSNFIFLSKQTGEVGLVAYYTYTTTITIDFSK